MQLAGVSGLVNVVTGLIEKEKDKTPWDYNWKKTSENEDLR